jgi:hypothetical protein
MLRAFADRAALAKPAGIAAMTLPAIAAATRTWRLCMTG